MAIRNKNRTLRREADVYELTLAELLAAAEVPPADVVPGERWTVRISGDSVTLTRHRDVVINPPLAAAPAVEPTGRV